MKKTYYVGYSISVPVDIEEDEIKGLEYWDKVDYILDHSDKISEVDCYPNYISDGDDIIWEG